MSARIPVPQTLGRGPFTTRAARERGIGEGRLRGRDLSRPFYGIRSAAPAQDLLDLARALQLRMPAAAFLCSATAAQLIGIPLPYRISALPCLHVAMPAPGRAPRAAGTIGHKLQLHPGDVGTWHGLRLTTTPRTWCDLATLLDLEDLVAAGDRIIHHRHPLATRRELEVAVTQHPGRRGRGRLRDALGLLSDHADSPPESIIRVTILRAGIQGLVPNHRIRDRHGNTFWADLCFPAHRVIFEYQGDYHRSEPDRWRKDRTRIALLTAAGWHVIEIAADELADRRILLQIIRDALSLHPALHPVVR